MTDVFGIYSPINCEFHDVLEALATTGKPAAIRFLDERGVAQLRMATVDDLYARNGAEYLSLSSGEIVRLDRILEADGEILKNYRDV